MSFLSNAITPASLTTLGGLATVGASYFENQEVRNAALSGTLIAGTAALALDGLRNCCCNKSSLMKVIPFAATAATVAVAYAAGEKNPVYQKIENTLFPLILFNGLLDTSYELFGRCLSAKNACCNGTLNTIKFFSFPVIAYAGAAIASYAANVNEGATFETFEKDQKMTASSVLFIGGTLNLIKTIFSNCCCPKAPKQTPVVGAVSPVAAASSGAAAAAASATKFHLVVGQAIEFGNFIQKQYGFDVNDFRALGRMNPDTLKTRIDKPINSTQIIIKRALEVKNPNAFGLQAFIREAINRFAASPAAAAPQD